MSFVEVLHIKNEHFLFGFWGYILFISHTKMCWWSRTCVVLTCGASTTSWCYRPPSPSAAWRTPASPSPLPPSSLGTSRTPTSLVGSFLWLCFGDLLKHWLLSSGTISVCYSELLVFHYKSILLHAARFLQFLPCFYSRRDCKNTSPRDFVICTYLIVNSDLFLHYLVTVNLLPTLILYLEFWPVLLSPYL